MTISAFFAYPANPSIVGQTVEEAIRKYRIQRVANDLIGWKELDIPGRFIAEKVLEGIDKRDALVADISSLNFNVLYELGFAIGRRKRVFVVRNSAVAPDVDAVKLGIVDTLGYQSYSNSDELTKHLLRLEDGSALTLPTKRATSAPIYLNQGKHRTDQEAAIVSTVKKLGFKFRSFDPNESSRLSAFDAIAEVFQSFGVVVHLVSTDQVESRIHNLRAAFIAGLAAGGEIPVCLLQTGDSPVPLDVRDFVAVCHDRNDYKDTISEFAPRVWESVQAGDPKGAKVPEGFLASLNLGSSSAENEMADLGNYYLEIDAYLRAKRKEVRLITGRKGSGKTAIFFQLRDKVRQSKANVVLDLKPDGYQLLKFKERVLSIMKDGTVEHTLTAFWEYLLLLETCYKLLEKDQDVHKRDNRLFEPYQRLKAVYEGENFIREGDFAERMATLLDSIAADFAAQYEGSESTISIEADELTKLLYRHDVAKLRALVQGYLQFKGELWLLFDNIDKGWPTTGLRREDLVIVRSLVEATRKIERELRQKHIDAHTVVFLRNDVYELLLEETPDRGKETRANVDWTDPDALKELVRRRIVYSQELDVDLDFDHLWRQICAPVIDGQESFRYLVDRSLMRPRSLIDLIAHCRGFAINARHAKIAEEDVEKGLHAFSSNLVTELCLEIRDIFPDVSDVLYAFIGCNSTLTLQKVREHLTDFGVMPDQINRVVELLIWFGFVGVFWNGDPKFVYNVNYDMKLLKGFYRSKNENDVLVQVNPVFWKGLVVEVAQQ